MDGNFGISLKWLAEHEGGVTNLKDDRGGLTNLGVTHTDYDHFRRWKGLPLRSVTLITREEANELYHEFYWKTVQCDKLSSGVDYCIFDMAVNNGVVGAAKCAQTVCSKLSGRPVAVDGHVGPITLDTIDDCDPIAFIDAFCNQRLKIDSGFFNWRKFGRAWTNRVNGNKSLGISAVRDQSKTLALASPVTAPAVKPAMPVQPVSTNKFSNLIQFFASLLAKLFKRA